MHPIMILAIILSLTSFVYFILMDWCIRKSWNFISWALSIIAALTGMIALDYIIIDSFMPRLLESVTIEYLIKELIQS